MKNSENKQNWGAYWSGRTGADMGDALVGAGVEHNPVLEKIWQDVFQDVTAQTHVLDLACGAGSALRYASAAGAGRVTGADISEGAIAALLEKVPTAEGSVCSADAAPFDDNTFDFVVSQFGFEYAGAMGAAAEAGRLLKSGGRFVAISHYKGGGIDVEVAGQLSLAHEIEATRFSSAAKDFFKADFEKKDKNPYTDVFAKSGTALADLIKKQTQQDNATSMAMHLYQGVRQLYERRHAYILKDLTGWIEAMEQELSTFKGRMQSMQNAALSEQDAQDVLTVLKKAGCDTTPPETIYLKEGELPAAWRLQAQKL